MQDLSVTMWSVPSSSPGHPGAAEVSGGPGQSGPEGPEHLQFILFLMRKLEFLGSFFFWDENVRAGATPGCAP